MNYGDGETQSYGFDPMGDRLTKSDSMTTGGTTTTTTTASTFDAANRLLTTAQNGGTASSVTSDADGNTLTDSAGRVMTWDSQNRMASCVYKGVTSTFKYGADGLRRQATVGGVTTDYAYDGTTLIREGHATGGTLTPSTITATYLQGVAGTECRIDETQQTEGYYNPNDATPRPLHARGITKWYVYDGLGSVVGEVDPSGNLTSSPKYDVYGGVRSNSGTASSKMGFVGGLGHLSEANTGLIYMRARYYDPIVGRFVSQDPDFNGINWFMYCSDNPVNRVDATGRIDTEILIDIQRALSDAGGLGPYSGTDLIKKASDDAAVGILNARIQDLTRESAAFGAMSKEYMDLSDEYSLAEDHDSAVYYANLSADSGIAAANRVAAATTLAGIRDYLAGDADDY